MTDVYSNNSEDAFATASASALDLSRVHASLVIGITGHRNIREQDRSQLQGTIKSILLGLKNRYSATPLILLSALAEGADRIAAQVALSEEIQGGLFVPLPMPKSVYETDFQGESLPEFRSLFARAEGSVELPLVDGNSLEAISRRGEQRDLQYESVGKYIVQKSQILIALWDGVESGMVGGTASVVKFQRDGLPPVEPGSLEAPDCFPVYWIATPRETNPNPEGVPFRLKVLYPHSFGDDEKKAEAYYDRMFSRINEFNQFASHADAALLAQIVNSKRDLLHDSSEEQFSDEQRAELNRFAVADALAVRFQRKKVKTDKELHIVVFMAFLSFVAFAHLAPNERFFLLASLVLATWGIYRRQSFRKKNGDKNFEDYRAMAEGLRVRVFWKLVGLKDSVADHYLGKQRTELDWIRNVFRGWDVHSESTPDVSGWDLQEHVERARVHWVEDQKSYFCHASERDEGHHENIELCGEILAGTALSIGGLLLLMTVFCPCFLRYEWIEDTEVNGLGILLVLIDAALAGAALIHNYGTRMAYREQAEQYERMEGVFARANSAVRTQNDPDVAVQWLRSLGKEALSENGDWVLLHRERPLEVPHP